MYISCLAAEHAQLKFQEEDVWFAEQKARAVMHLMDLEQKKLTNEEMKAAKADQADWSTTNNRQTKQYIITTITKPNLQSNLFLTRKRKRKRKKTCTLMKDFHHGTTLGMSCNYVSQRVHLIGDSSGSRKLLHFWSHFVFGCRGCLAPNVGGLVCPSYLI